MKKRIVAIAISLLIVVTLNTMMPLFAQTPPKHDDDWYMVSKGVLDSDYYTLYPYDLPSLKSLNIGFSKYGELIGSPPSVPPDQIPPPGGAADWVGLEFDGRDAFCNPGVPMERWINGWMIDIEYIHSSPVIAPDRHVWAFALFSDGGNWGYDWTKAIAPDAAPHSGRKTNTRVETEDIKVIYDGPRRFVAQMVNHIYDQEPGLPDWPVLDVIITLIFNKVKHEVLLLKDIKLTIPSKDLDGKMNVEFSEREEWDLGPAPSYYSYPHFYEEEMDTCYGDEWHLAKQILRHWEGERKGDGGKEYMLTSFTPPIPKLPVAEFYEKVYIDRKLKRKPTDYRIDYANGKITFAKEILDTQTIEVKCKYVDKDPLPHLYDVAQFISTDKKYVGWAAYWPVVSQYTVDGWAHALEKLIDVKEPDAATEPRIPFLIAQWDFLLDPEDVIQYRCVEVKGVTHYHNAGDWNMDPDYGNVIDSEVLYQLEEIFNPWDLRQAAHKETRRWVEFFVGNDVKTDFKLENGPVTVDSFWDYCGFPERVLLNGELLHRGEPQSPIESNIYSGYDLHHREYDLVIDPDTGKGTIHFYEAPAKGENIKVLYSTDTEYTKEGCMKMEYEEVFTDVQLGDVITWQIPGDVSWTDPLNVTHRIEFTKNITVELDPRLIVAFDESHRPYYRTTGAYSGFAGELVANGYVVTTIAPGTTITPDVLATVDVLVMVAPQGAYAAAEIDAIEAWVKGGGRLLLISDWGPFAPIPGTIAARFNINFAQDQIQDTDEFVGGNTFWPFYIGPNLLPHPVTAGVRRVEIYLGDGILAAPAPVDEIPLIVTDVDGTGTWSDGTPALGVSVMNALDDGTAGDGRLIVITDCGLWHSQRDSDGDGTNDFFDSDNEILALNSINWLAEELNTSKSFEKVEPWGAENFKVYRDSTYMERAEFVQPVAYEDNLFKVSTDLDIKYYITAPWNDTVHVKYLDKDIEEEINMTYNPDTNELTLRANVSVGCNYKEQIGGRYEWTVVGRNSRATDSAGAAMVTAAMKNKQMEIGLSSLDMKDNEFGPRIPYVHRFWTGTGNARDTYYDMLHRAALRDDYCKTWPVASSNEITVGGPFANLASEYWNDFTDIFVTSPALSPGIGEYGLYELTAWDYRWQGGVPVGGEWGLAIVSTYKDLNGTVGFILWGWTGDDTYFVTKWLHEPYWDWRTEEWYRSGLVYLQKMNPCATSLKIGIDYSDHPPRVWVDRILGTISEKPQHPDP